MLFHLKKKQKKNKTKKNPDRSGTKQNRISNKWQHLKVLCQCLFFFDFLWDLCGDRDWDLDFFPDFLGDLDRDRLDLLGVLEPDGDLRKQTKTIYHSTPVIQTDFLNSLQWALTTNASEIQKAINFPDLYFAHSAHTHTHTHTHTFTRLYRLLNLTILLYWNPNLKVGIGDLQF